LTQIGDSFLGGENIDNLYPGLPAAFDYGNDPASAVPHAPAPTTAIELNAVICVSQNPARLLA